MTLPAHALDDLEHRRLFAAIVHVAVEVPQHRVARREGQEFDPELTPRSRRNRAPLDYIAFAFEFALGQRKSGAYPNALLTQRICRARVFQAGGDANE